MAAEELKHLLLLLKRLSAHWDLLTEHLWLYFIHGHDSNAAAGVFQGDNDERGADPLRILPCTQSINFREHKFWDTL